LSAIEPAGDACAQLVDGFVNPGNRRLKGLEDALSLSQPFIETRESIEEGAIGGGILGAPERLLRSRETLIYTQTEIVKLCQRGQMLFRGNRLSSVRYLLPR
jgi:hypothetical protein